MRARETQPYFVQNKEGVGVPSPRRAGPQMCAVGAVGCAFWASLRVWWGAPALFRFDDSSALPVRPPGGLRRPRGRPEVWPRRSNRRPKQTEPAARAPAPSWVAP